VSVDGDWMSPRLVAQLTALNASSSTAGEMPEAATLILELAAVAAPAVAAIAVNG
jgi:hypothetical protein